jgi:hypothetical protein
MKYHAAVYPEALLSLSKGLPKGRLKTDYLGSPVVPTVIGECNVRLDHTDLRMVCQMQIDRGS